MEQEEQGGDRIGAYLPQPGGDRPVWAQEPEPVSPVWVVAVQSEPVDEPGVEGQGEQEAVGAQKVVGAQTIPPVLVPLCYCYSEHWGKIDSQKNPK